MRLSSKLAGALSLSFALLAGLGLTSSSVASAAPGPTNPDYAVLSECSANPGATGALVILTNAGAEHPVVFTVNGVDHTVEPDATDSFVIPGVEGDTVHLTITAADTAFTPVELDVLVDCVQPAVTLTHGCAEGGALASLTNAAGVLPAVFTIEVDGTPFGSALTVAGGATSSVVVPMSEGQTSIITLREASEASPLASAAFTHDCVNPNASLVEDCAANGGAQLTYTNTGTSSVGLGVAKNGTLIDTVTVPAGQTVTKTYALEEDEMGTFRVTGPAYDSGALPVNHDCAEVLPFEIDRAPAAALPRTGAEVGPLFLLAVLLMLIGAALVAGDSACTSRRLARDTHAESEGGSD